MRTVTVIGKKELAARLGWSRHRLDRFLKTHPGAPVRKIGDQSGGWEFVWEEWVAHLGFEPDANSSSTPKAIDLEQLRDAVKPATQPATVHREAAPRRASHGGEASARQRKDELDGDLKELKLKAAAGEYLKADITYQKFAAVIASLAASLDAAAPEVVRQTELAPEMEAVVRAIFDRLRSEMVDQAERTLRDGS